VDTPYKTHRYKVQSLIRLKIVWNDMDVSKHIIKRLVIRLTTSVDSNFLKKNKIMKNKHLEINWF